jgi:hypothetical protein
VAVAGLLVAAGVALSGQLSGFGLHNLSDQQQSGLVDELVETKADDLVDVDLLEVDLEGVGSRVKLNGKALPLSLTREELGEEDFGMGGSP